ncbi:MAG: glycosyltransferase family 117 protein [Brevinematia bacterium]
MANNNYSTSSGVESKFFNSIYPYGYNPYKLKLIDLIIGTALFLIVFIGYIMTLTPSVGAGDNGELTTTLYNMGAGHPPGYPLFGIVGKLFTFLPVGDIAYRVNLFVAFFGAGASLFLYLFSVKLLGLNRDNGKLNFFIHFPAIAASFSFGFSYSHWGQSVGGEVYPLNVFLVSLMLFVMYLWYEEMIYFRMEDELHFAERRTLLLFFVMGLSLTNHQLPLWYIVAYGVVLLPVTVIIVVLDRTKKFKEEFSNRVFAFFILGVTALITAGFFVDFGFVKRLLFQKDVPEVLTTIFLVPSFLTFYTIFVKFIKPEKNWVDKFFEILAYGSWLFIFALSIYLYLWVRAKALAPLPDPKPLSWGDTQRLDILFNHMLRKQYGIGGGRDLNYALGQWLVVFKYHFEQFHFTQFIFIVIGFIYLFLKERIWATFSIVAMFFLNLALVWFINFELDVRTVFFQEVFFIQNFLFLGLFLAFGYQFVLDIVNWLSARIKILPKKG